MHGSNFPENSRIALVLISPNVLKGYSTVQVYRQFAILCLRVRKSAKDKEKFGITSSFFSFLLRVDSIVCSRGHYKIEFRNKLLQLFPSFFVQGHTHSTRNFLHFQRSLSSIHCTNEIRLQTFFVKKKRYTVDNSSTYRASIRNCPQGRAPIN